MAIFKDVADIQTADMLKLRMLKSEYRSQHFRLEDSLLKHYPQQIASVTERIAGIEKDIAAYTAEKEKVLPRKLIILINRGL